MFFISLERISPSVSRVTGRQAAHFHILSHVQANRTQLLSSLPLSVHVLTDALLCSQACDLRTARSLVKKVRVYHNTDTGALVS